MSEVLINVHSNSFVLTGDTEIIFRKRRAKSNFQSIGAIFREDGSIALPFSTSEGSVDLPEREERFQQIEHLLEKFSVDGKQSESTENLLERINAENRNFAEFSIKAKNIRNNLHEGSDFQMFTESVSERLTARSLYPLQLLSAYHLAFAQNACNFSVPGAGKTSIVYGAYSHLKGLDPSDPKYVDRLLIVGPIASFAPWRDEYEECFSREPVTKRLDGVNANDRMLHFLSEKYTELTLISYQGLASTADDVIPFLKRYNVMVVLDEAHRIKNIDGGQWAQAALSIAKLAKARVVLTGTPAPNGYEDLINMFTFIWPNRRIITAPPNYLRELSQQMTPSARQSIDKLVEEISPFFIRIKKGDLGLPIPVNNDPVRVPMSPVQKEIYDYIADRYINHLQSTTGADGIAARIRKARWIRLLQCATNPNLLTKPLDDYFAEEGITSELNIDDSEVMRSIMSYRESGEVPGKFLAVADHIERTITAEGPSGKTIVWSIFIQTMHDFQEYLKSRGITAELIYGAVPTESDDSASNVRSREQIIRDFHDLACEFKVIIANPFAVGESISLHKACHNAIYLEKNFNAAMFMQSKDRIHRVGLGNNDVINYHYFLSENSIDEVVHGRVLEKEARMIDIIEHEEIPLLSMNSGDNDEDEGDIKAIIRHYYARRDSTDG